MNTSLAARHPVRIGQTLLHLAVVGTLGWAVIGALFGFIGTGIALVPIVGVGLFILAGVVYALFGVAWFETARIAGLYGIETSSPTFERRVKPTFGGWLRALGRQLLSGRMWWALANFFISCVLGAVLVPAVQAVAWGIGTIVSPTSGIARGIFDWRFPFPDLGTIEARVFGVVVLVLGIAIAIGLALLHRTLGIAIIGSQVRESALASEARQSAAAAAESAQQREGAVRAADVERTRIERDLHDGVQPRLVSVGMTLGLAQQQIDADPEAAKALIAEAHTSTKAAITELRQLARGIHASVLDDRGLDAALSALAGRSHIPVTLDVRMGDANGGRVDRAAESAVYFVIAESLTNAAKHSRAAECRVTVRVRELDGTGGKALWARIEDNGVGGAQVQPGGGLDGISNRVRAAGGTIRIDSPAGGPTAVEVSVPCAS